MYSMHTRHINRRDLLRSVLIGLGAGSVSGWLKSLASAAVQQTPKQSVILLWLSGGPSTIDLWDLKPSHENGGPTKEIATTVPGITVSEQLPRLADVMNDVVLVRSMTSREGDHGRATHLARTGYVPQASIQFPALGALVADGTLQGSTALPNFVSIAPARAIANIGGGFLGPRCAPLVVGPDAMNAAELRVPNIVRHAAVSDAAHAQRAELLRQFNHQFAQRHAGIVVDSLRTASERAQRVMQPEAVQAFQLGQEPAHRRDAYGRNLFGQGCLLARRLVERRVSFVEVTLDGWDTHSENFPRVAALAATLDAALAALLGDLKQHGLLDTTLVICQGEFGRTPKINRSAGRDHYPAAWATLLAGGGLDGGRVIGATSDDGSTVVDRPVTPPDLLATICRRLGIDPRKQNMSNVGRPIRVADPAAELITELL